MGIPGNSLWYIIYLYILLVNMNNNKYKLYMNSKNLRLYAWFDDDEAAILKYRAFI